MKKVPPKSPSTESRVHARTREPSSRGASFFAVLLFSASLTMPIVARAADPSDTFADKTPDTAGTQTHRERADKGAAPRDAPKRDTGEMEGRRRDAPADERGGSNERHRQREAAGAESRGDRAFADKPIARLGDQPITLDDIEPEIAYQVYRQKLETYTLLVRAVNDLVERRLLAAEAERRGVSLEELERLLEEEAEPASQADVDAYLEKNPAAAAEPNARERAAYDLTEQRRIRTRLDFVNALRERANFKMLLAPPRQPRVAISTTAAPARGAEDAPLVVVHFASFTSEQSAGAAESIRRLERELPGRVRWVHRSLPDENDDVALAAAHLGAEAQDKGKFWELHDRLFELRGNVKAADLERVAGELGIPPVHPGDTCHLESIRRDADDARRIGIRAAPAIFVNGRYFSPTLPYAELRALAANELGEARDAETASRGEPARRAVPPEKLPDHEP